MFFKCEIRPKEYPPINSLQVVFLREFHGYSKSNQIKKVHDLLKDNNFDLIVTLACNSLAFREICLLPEFSQSWEQLWRAYGIILTNDPKKAFYAQPNVEEFDLFLGVYFYKSSVEVAKEMKKDFTACELTCLSQAIKYGSIHAYQRQHQQVYKLSEEDTDSPVTMEKQLKKVISDIKKLIPTYGSYAYLLLVEAYVRYGLFLGKNGNFLDADKMQVMAVKACGLAEKHMKDEGSSNAIFNASLGGVLLEANYGMKTIDFPAIRERITQSFDELWFEDTAITVLPK